MGDISLMKALVSIISMDMTMMSEFKEILRDKSYRKSYVNHCAGGDILWKLMVSS